MKSKSSLEVIYEKMVEKYGEENVTKNKNEIIVIDKEGESHRIWMDKK